ncbi:MAG: hypothetical protein FWG96_02360 [Methanomassiliicoccaceae archaeon]|nr:hypothetical protein [Methanomassiliicoccaceae archaeon]
MIYDVIVRTEPEESLHADLSYEDVLTIFIDRLLSDEQLPLTIRRRCCSSVHEHTMSVETCNEIRELAGVMGRSENKKEDPADIRTKLDIAVNNWYLRGKISLSDENIIKPLDSRQVG